MLTPSDLKWFRGVSRISARGVLKVRPGGGRGGGNSLQVRYEKWGGGGGGGRGLFGTKLIINVAILTKGVLKHFTRAQMNLIVVFNFIHSSI